MRLDPRKEVVDQRARKIRTGCQPSLAALVCAKLRLLLPLLVPLLIGAAQATEPLLRPEAVTEDLGRWLGVLSLYDVVFLLLSVGVFDYLLED